MNMIIGKRQIILAALVLGLSVAIYLNFALSNQAGELATNGNASDSENYGDALFTGTSDSSVIETGDAESANAEFFAQARLTRQKTRDESVQTIQTMLADSALAEEQQAMISEKAVTIAQAIEIENRIENLIKAKGFTECLAYIDGESANIIVQTDGLLSSEAAQIKDIVLQESNVEVENIKIVEVK